MYYSIITFGCQMNKSDSERIAFILEEKGFRLAPKESEADLIVVNMCSVRQPAVDRVYGLFPKFKKLKEKNKNLKTVLTGCILKEDRKKFAERFNLILDIKHLPKWSKLLKKNKNAPVLTYAPILPWQNSGVVDEVAASSPPFAIARVVDGVAASSPPFARLRLARVGNIDYPGIKPKYSNNSSAFVPISNGCNNFCSYCVVPLTRDSLTCRGHQDILKEVENLAKNGVKEIWLLGQNVNDYHSPSNKSINFAKLLKMVNDIPGDFKIIFTSPHPNNFSDELIGTLAKCGKFGKYLNLPVQSGDNEILKKMNRNYTAKQYKNLVRKIRKKIPGIKLSTDVIVGFPGEREKQFQNTVKLFKETKFDNAYISKYSPRPGTAAWQMADNVPRAEKKRREKILREIFK